jgi:hypothetical protein
MAKSVPSPGRKSNAGRGKRVPVLIMVLHAKPMPQRAMKRGKPSKSKR